MQQRLLNMLEFKPLTIADRQWVEELVMKENSPNADYNFSNMYIWNTNYRQLIARVGDRMISQLRYDPLIFHSLYLSIISTVNRMGAARLDVTANSFDSAVTLYR